MSLSAGDVIEGHRTVPRCPNCRDVNGVYLHEGPVDSIFECIHCDQLFTFNPIGRRVADSALDARAAQDVETPQEHETKRIALKRTLNDAFDLLVDVGGVLDEAIAARRLGPGQKRAEAASIRSYRFLAEAVQRFPWLAGERRALQSSEEAGKQRSKEAESGSGSGASDLPSFRASEPEPEHEPWGRP